MRDMRIPISDLMQHKFICLCQVSKLVLLNSLSRELLQLRDKIVYPNLGMMVPQVFGCGQILPESCSREVGYIRNSKRSLIWI